MESRSNLNGINRSRAVEKKLNALRDETYRSMLRFEAGKAGATSSPCSHHGPSPLPSASFNSSMDGYDPSPQSVSE